MLIKTSRRAFLQRATVLAGAVPVVHAPSILADAFAEFKTGRRHHWLRRQGRGESGGRCRRKSGGAGGYRRRTPGGCREQSLRGRSEAQDLFDYRKMFDTMHKEIDAVFVATPDHHHAPASMMAMKIGKHVFCEKPLCRDISQARALAEGAKRHNVVTLMGNQGHCAEGYRRLCEYIWTGAIGDVVETHSWSGFVNGAAGPRPPSKPVPAGLHWDEWLGPSPFREYHDGLHPAYWRYYRDFGTGGLGDWGCHNLDGVFWALKIGHPASIECLGTVGGSDEKYPQASVIRWNIPAPCRHARLQGPLVRRGPS